MSQTNKNVSVSQNNDDNPNHASTVTASQKKVLFEFIKNNPDVIKSKHTNKLTKANINKQWENTALLLNAIPGGAFKNVKQWKKVKINK